MPYPRAGYYRYIMMRHSIKERIYPILLSWIVLSLFSGCSRVSDEEIIAARKAVKEGAVIIDVRTRDEYRQKHIEGARNIPVHLLERAYPYLPKDKALVVYCREGHRSAVAAKMLREQGWEVYDVATQEDWEREIK